MRGEKRHPAFRFLMRLIAATVVISTFFVVSQDFQIFPGLYSSIILGNTSSAPPEIDELKTTASDGQVVTVWRSRVDKEAEKGVALLFHGNAETVSSFKWVQGWLKTYGISSYSVEYRGYNGRNSGWPSEEGFYRDAEAAFELMKKEEGVEQRKIIVIGSSIGTGIAAHVAHKYNVGTLLLLSPFTSLKDLVSELPVFGFLTPFLKYQFPTKDIISSLPNTCLILAHGKRDGTIPFSNSEKLAELHKGTGTLIFLTSESAGHNDLLAHLEDQIPKAIFQCLESAEIKLEQV